MFSLPEPLHPAVVHLPMALAVLVPAFALLGVLAIQRGVVPIRAWAGVLLLQLALVGSGLAALRTGEVEEELVENMVAERHIEAHEEEAERFQIAAAIALAFFAAGLLPGTAGAAGRWASVAAALVVLGLGLQVGHSGGELVYRHGAASAYASPQGGEASHDD